MAGREVITTLALKLSDMATAPMQKAMDRIDKSTRQVSGSLQRLKTIAVAAFAGWGIYKVVEKMKEVVLAAARYETLGVAMHTVGNNAGYASQQMDEFQKGLEKTGISMSGARQALTRMTQAQLDLTKSAQLARVAQDTAVIGAINSTEAFNQLVYGIQSANVRVLRTIGINVIFKDSYKGIAEQLGRTVGSFTEAEKASIRLNAVLKAGERIAGTYEAAMETAGKQLFSLERHFDNLETMAGAAFTPALLEIVQSITGEIKDLNKELSGESTERIHEWGVGFRLTLIDIKIELMSLALLLDKIGGTMTTVMVGLFSFGNAVGNKNSQKQYTEWMKKNIEYEKRYWQTVIDIVALEEKQLVLKYALTDVGKAQAKVRADMLEKERLAASAAAKALEAQRLAEKATTVALKEVNKELDKYYKELDKAKAAMDQVTLAAMPEYERGIESITRQYVKWNKAIDKNAELAGHSLEQISGLHKDLGVRMGEDIAEYVKSHAECTEQIDELWVRALDRVQSTLADTFMDGMKGELDSFRDVFKSFCDSILRYWSEMAAKMTMYDIFGVGKGAGGSGWGNLLGGIFGGGGSTGQTAAHAALTAGRGPMSEESALAQGFRNTVQGASTAWSLKGAYGAYGAAGGGWGGLQAGVGSFFGYGGGATAAPAATWSSVGGFPTATMGAGASAGSISGAIKSIFSSIPISYYILAGYLAGDYFTKQNVKRGYGRIEGGPQGYGPYQPINPLYGGRYGDIDYRIGSSGVDPAQTWASGVLGGGPTAGDYFAYHVDQGNWGDAFKTAPFVADQWANPFGPQFWTNVMGMPDWADPMKMLGISNKKRSYYGKSFEYGEYSPETGWGDPLGEVYRDKRKGEKAFGESGEGMAQTGQDLLNSLDSLFKDLLGRFGETWEDLFKTKMIDLSAPGLSFDFYISAEDKGEFQDDWRKSWAAMAEGLISPLVEAGSDLLSQALDGAVTDATAWNYFSDEMREHLRTGLEEGLAGLKIDWSAATSQEAFEAAFEQMGVAIDNIQGIVEYFDTVGSIMDQVSEALGMSEFSGAALSAIQNLRNINIQFDEFANVLLSLGVDIKKYTDLEIARHIAITAEVKAMADATMSGEDLALSLKYMREEMEAAGHAAHEIADAMDSAFSGILESIEDIERRHEDYGKTALDLLLEKHPEWGDVSTYDQWTEINQMFRSMFEELRYDYAKPYDFEGWLREQQGIDAETLQEWRNLGLELEKLFEKMYDEMAQDPLVDEVKNLVDAENDIAKELVKVLKEFRDFQVKLMSELFGITGQGAMALSPEQWKVVMAEAFKDQVPGNAGLDLDIDLIQNLMNLGQDYMNSMKMQFTSQYDWIKFVSMFLKDIDHIMMRLGSAGTVGRKTFGYDMDKYFYEPGRGMTDTGPSRFEHYASGGWHPGGLRVVGEHGPELEYTPPARIYSNDMSKQMIGSNQGVVDEIKGLKAVVNDLFGEISRNTKDQTDISKRWDWDGMPPERT